MTRKKGKRKDDPDDPDTAQRELAKEETWPGPSNSMQGENRSRNGRLFDRGERTEAWRRARPGGEGESLDRGFDLFGGGLSAANFLSPGDSSGPEES